MVLNDASGHETATLFDPSWPSQEGINPRKAEICDNTADSTPKQLSEFAGERIKNIFSF